ncbi:MAG TPA: FkbM family methyltransferase [Thermoanaerobaculia bacterium]|nr:FkbM family methyltransferase [Thermoanaerobaculia bacterium]
MFKRLPSKRALAAAFKVRGRRLERRWPFVPRAAGDDLNLRFDDLLELQWARSRDFVVVVVGAFDGVENDPVSRFIRARECRGVLIEPQPAAFARLRENFARFPRIELLNAAIDETSGSRALYSVPPSEGFPPWIEQIASFSPDHIRKHESQAPGLSARMIEQPIRTLSFDALLDELRLDHIDVLQIDAEGMDGKMLGWFPFERMRPGVLYYESTHLSQDEQRTVRARLERFGYKLFAADSPTDTMAVIA